MSLTRYRFRTHWALQAAPSTVFGTLVDLERYPEWWPDVRAVRRVDGDTADLLCRATLPFVLRLRLTRVEQDPQLGRLRVALSGDLAGSLTASVQPCDAGTQLYVTQDVMARTPLLRSLSLVGHPLLRANHAAMMRRGLCGLRRQLA